MYCSGGHICNMCPLGARVTLSACLPLHEKLNLKPSRSIVFDPAVNCCHLQISSVERNFILQRTLAKLLSCDVFSARTGGYHLKTSDRRSNSGVFFRMHPSLLTSLEQTGCGIIMHVLIPCRNGADIHHSETSSYLGMER